jgi:hypothetical protein
MIWIVIAIALVVLVGWAERGKYDQGEAIGISILGFGILALFINLFFAFSGQERVLESKCNLKPLANGAYVAIVDGDIAYQCDDKVIPTTVASYNTKIEVGGPTASIYYGKKESRLWSVFNFKGDSERTYVYVPNGIAATSVPK